jgi:hypothetical protein
MTVLHRLSVSALLLLCLPAWARAQSAADPNAIAQGYELLAAGERLAAIQHFERIAAVRPGDLAARFGALAGRHMRLEYDDSEQAVFEQRLDQLIVDAEARHRRNEQDAEALFYLAQAHMLRGGYRFEYDKGMWGAARDGAKAKSYSEAYVAGHPEHADAYLTLGLYNYYVALAPSLFRAVGWMLFLPAGDRAEGLRQIERAAASGNWFAPRARLLLMDIYGSTERRPAEALAMGRRLRERYPQNDNVEFAIAALQQSPAFEDRDLAAAAYQRVIDRRRSATSIDEIASRMRATIGLAGVRQEQWRLDEAIGLVTSVIDSGVKRPAWALPQARLRRSNYLALLNDPSAAVDAKAILTDGTATAAWRKAAREQISWIEKRAASGEGLVYAALIPGNRLTGEKRWAEARQEYARVAAQYPGHPQVRYRIAWLAFASGDAERALPEMTALAAGGRTIPGWLKAGALLVVARTHDLAGRRDQARRTYQAIVDRHGDERPAAAARLGLITPYARPVDSTNRIGMGRDTNRYEGYEGYVSYEPHLPNERGPGPNSVLAAAGLICSFGSTARVRPRCAEVAQLVEHVTENHGVGSSILPLGTRQS